MKKETAALIRKAHRSLKSAKMLLDEGDPDFAVSRAYYAMFYVAEAALLARGKTYSKHTGVINGFYHEFIATGALPKQLHSHLHSAFEDRNLGDYGFMESFPVRDARELLANAKAFLTTVEKMIKAS